MPDHIEGLRHWLWERGFQFISLDYTISLAEQLVQITVEAADRRGEFSFTLGDSIPRIAASILLAFDKNRHLQLQEIPGAVSLTYINPRGASYDYGPQGVTLDRSSVESDADLRARVRVELVGHAIGQPTLPTASGTDLDAIAEYYGLWRTAPVPTSPKKSEEPKSCWDRLLDGEALC